jgi:hypothetical protein
MTLEDAEVYTSDGKSAGRIVKVNSEYFTSRKVDFMLYEEYRIPLNAISYIEPAKGDMIIVRLTLNEIQLKHGYEFVRGNPNSKFVSGEAESQPLVPNERQVIYYEAMESLEENDTTARAQSDRLLQNVEKYSCDMCMEKFDDVDNLQKHRAKDHKGPIGI